MKIVYFIARYLIFIFILKLGSHLSNGFIFKQGQCSYLPTAEDLDLEKFSGKWYVIQGSNVASRCYTMEWVIGDDGSYTLKVDKQLYSLRIAGIVHNFHFEAPVYVDPKNAANMVVRFPSNMFGDVTYQVTGTTYDDVSLIYSCKDSVFGHLQSYLILSRTPTLKVAVIEELNELMSRQGLILDDIASVQQFGCDQDIDGGFFTIQIAKSLTSNPVSWSNLNDPALSDTGCFVDKGDYYLFYPECPVDGSNPINFPVDSNTTDYEIIDVDIGDNSTDEEEYYYYYYYEDEAAELNNLDYDYYYHADDYDNNEEYDEDYETRIRSSRKIRGLPGFRQSVDIKSEEQIKLTDSKLLNKIKSNTKIDMESENRKSKPREKSEDVDKMTNSKVMKILKTKSEKLRPIIKQTKQKTKRNPYPLADLIVVSKRLQNFLANKNVDLTIIPKNIKINSILSYISRKEKKTLRALIETAKRKLDAVRKVKRAKSKGIDLEIVSKPFKRGERKSKRIQQRKNQRRVQRKRIHPPTKKLIRKRKDPSFKTIPQANNSKLDRKGKKIIKVKKKSKGKKKENKREKIKSKRVKKEDKKLLDKIKERVGARVKVRKNERQREKSQNNKIAHINQETG